MASRKYREFKIRVNVAESLPQASKPKIVASTSLPRSVLSYKWVIKDAKTLLIQNDDGLVSPTFKVSLPGKKESTGETGISSWHLHVSDYRSSRLAIRLWYVIEEYGCQSPTEVAISHCVFTLVDFKTKKTIWTSRPFTKRCAINSTRTLARKFDAYNLDQVDDALVIQVDASLVGLCFAKRNETLQYESLETVASSLPLYDGMKTLLDGRKLVDVTIKCGVKEFTAHKAVLASQSPVFQRMLETDMKEKRTGIIEVSDTDPEVISQLLSYLYTGKVSNASTTAKELIAIANKYEISQLHAVCAKSLQSSITASNVAELLVLSDLHQAPDLKEACLNYIYHNSAEVRSSAQWKQQLRHNSNSLQVLAEAVEFIPSPSP